DDRRAILARRLTLVNVTHRSLDPGGRDLAAHRLVIANLDVPLALGVGRYRGDLLVAGQAQLDVLGACQGETRGEQRRDRGALENRAHVSPSCLTWVVGCHAATA